MRPIKLTMSAFGPYANKVELDMTKLGTNGLYLISGTTGAGKTTIFDGIMYALYGKPSGNVREVSMLRSKGASPDTLTYVDLEFVYGDKTYRIMRNPGGYLRTKARGEGTADAKQEVELYLPDGRVLTKEKEVKAEIESIMGITADQFSQVAMIAQGQFRDLLQADTVTRQKIFRQIFKTERFEKIAGKLADKSSNLKKVCEIGRNGLKQYVDDIACDGNDMVSALEVQKARNGELGIDEILELVGGLIENDEALKLEVDEKIADNQKQLDEINAVLKSAEDVATRKKQLADTENLKNIKVQMLSVLQNEYDTEKQKEPILEKLKTEIAVEESTLSEYDAFDAKASELNTLKTDKENKENQKIQAEDYLSQLIENNKKDEEILASLQHSGENHAKLKNEADKLSDEVTKLQNLKKAINDYNTNAAILERQQADYLAEKEKADALKNKYEAMNDAFLNEQAGVIAETLCDGKPCPVCGSTHHPSPAKKAENAPTKEELEAAKVRAENAQTTVSQKSSRAGEFKGTVETLKETALKSIAEILGDVELGYADIKADEKLSEIKGKATEISIQLQLEEEKVKKKERLQKAIPEHKKKEAEEQEKVSSMTAEIASLSAKIESLTAELAEKKVKLSYASKTEAQLSVVNKKNSLQFIENSLEKAKKDFENCKNEISEIDGRIKALKESLENVSEIDVAEYQNKKNKLDADNSALSMRSQLYFARIDRNKRTANNIVTASAELIKNEKEYAMVKNLADTATGNLVGKERIGLETYVQTSYFDRITRRATARLMNMTGGQFDLARHIHEEDEKFSGKTGLDLDVVDHNNGGARRSVGSLSGGEAFKASLSLALGFADEVQASAPGIRIDTMFVDEGFGSLDSESLDLAYKTLAGLSEGHRLVGIISHVEELKGKIDKQIVVTKDRSGKSKVEFVV